MRSLSYWGLLSAAFLLWLSGGIIADNDGGNIGPRVLQGHAEWVRWLHFVQNGAVLLSGSWDRTVKYWHLETGECKRTLKVHEYSLHSLAASTDGRLFATAGADGADGTQRSVKVWEVETGALKHTIKEASDVVSLSPDGRWLAASSIDQTVRLWDTQAAKILRELKGFQPITALAFSPDGKLLAAACSNVVMNRRPDVPGEILVWDTSTGELRFRQGELFSVEALAWSPQGNLLAAGVTVKKDTVLRRQLLICELGKALEVKHVLERPIVNDEVSGVAFAPSSQTIAIASGARVKMVNVQSGELSIELGDRFGRRTSAVAFSPDGKILAAAGADAAIKLWDLSKTLK
jgi:WD40 repeat protein